MAGRRYSEQQYHNDSHYYPQGGATNTPYTFSSSPYTELYHQCVSGYSSNSSIHFMSPGTPPNVLWQSDSGSSFTSFGHLSFSPSPSPSPKLCSSDVSSGLGSRSNSIPSLSGSSPSYIPSPIPQFPHSVYTTLKKQNSRPNNGDLTYKKLPPLPCAPNNYDSPRKKNASKQRSQHESKYQKEIVPQKPHPQDNTTKPIRLNEDHIRPETQNKTETIHQPDTHEGNETTSIHQPQTHDSKITDVPSCEKTTPTYRDKARPLGPIRKVQDTVTGEPEYSLDPLCPSNMDFQRRAEDEAAKFFHKLIDYASKLSKKINYEDPEAREKKKGERGITQDPEKVLGKYSLDFRWQMKHFYFNRTIYSTVVFCHKIPEEYICDTTQNLRHIADCLAHQQNLTDNYRHRNRGKRKCGTTLYIKEFFVSVIAFVEKVGLNIRHAKIQGLDIHSQNLHDIHDTFHEYLQYRRVHQYNLKAFQVMDKKTRKQKVREVVEVLLSHIEDENEWQEMIAVRIAAHINLQI